MRSTHFPDGRRSFPLPTWVPLGAVWLLLALASSTANADITLTGPATLSTANTTYVVANDITAAGTCFTIAASAVTLDLGGHTITYGAAAGTSYGIVTSGYSRNNLIIKNGTILQGAGNGSSCHALNIQNSSNVEIANLNITVQGPDTSNIYTCWNGPMNIHHCTLYDNNTVISNRHVGPGGMIEVNRNTGNTSVHDNKLYNGPWQGIRISSYSTAYDGGFKIYNNTISHRTRYANAYAISAWGRNSEVYGNTITAEGRGIHVGYDPSVNKPGGYWLVHDNYVDVKERPNAEYNPYWVHGIKVENADATPISNFGTVGIYNNTVIARAEPGHGEARALDISATWPNMGIEVYNNNITAMTTTTEFDAIALACTGIDEDAGVSIHDNTFSSNEKLVAAGSDAGPKGYGMGVGYHCSGVSMVSNTFGYVTPLSDHPYFIYFYIWENAAVDSLNNVFLDTRLSNGVSLDSIRVYAGTHTWYVRWYLNLAVQDEAGAPLAGANVAISDARGSFVYSGPTDAGGLIPRQALNQYLASGTSTTVPTKTMYTPHIVTVTKDGYGNLSQIVTMDHSQTVTLVMPSSGVLLSKSADRSTASPGDTVTYTLVYRNQTAAAITNVVITDAMPTNTTYVPGSATGGGVFSGGRLTWNIGTVAAGGRGSVSFRVTVD